VKEFVDISVFFSSFKGTAMYCPRCGQQQVSDEIKFCSKCGFQLGLMPELLRNNGFLPQLYHLENAPQSLLTRRNGLVFGGLWFVFFTLLMTSVLAIAGGDEIVALSAVLGLFGSIIIMIASLAFLPGKKKAMPSFQTAIHQTVPASLGNPSASKALPPEQSIPASQYAPPTAGWKSPDTGELVRPASVTEDTTKLLTKKESS
jgi:hypothetical protein